MVKQNSKKNELINALLKLLYIRITELYKKWNNNPYRIGFCQKSIRYGLLFKRKS